MAKFTFLEVHLEGASATASASYHEDRGEEQPPEEAGNGRRGVATLVGLGFLLVLTVVVRRRLADEGGTDPE